MPGLAMFALMLLAAAPPVLASIDKAGKDSPAKDPDRIVCQRAEQPGSRLLGKKVCLTARQWEELRRAEELDSRSSQQAARGMHSPEAKPEMMMGGPH